MAKISHIAKNMKIKKIGSLFKKHNSGSWAINLALKMKMVCLIRLY
jgi:hypothetical protein